MLRGETTTGEVLAPTTDAAAETVRLGLGVPASVVLHFAAEHEAPEVSWAEVQHAIHVMAPERRRAINDTLTGDNPMLQGPDSSEIRLRFTALATTLEQLDQAVRTDDEFKRLIQAGKQSGSAAA